MTSTFIRYPEQLTIWTIFLGKRGVVSVRSFTLPKGEGGTRTTKFVNAYLKKQTFPEELELVFALIRDKYPNKANFR